MLRILVVGLVLLVAAFVMQPRQSVPPPELATEYPDPLPVPSVELTDDTGGVYRTEDLEQRFTLMFFGFTHCPDVCPLSMQVLAAAIDTIEANQPNLVPDVVLVSVDPARDSPSRMREYLDNFDPAFRGVTGANGRLDPLLDAFGITVMRQALAGNNYNMTHNAQVFVIGPQAQLIAIMSKAEDARLVASDFLKIRQRFLSGAVRNNRSS